MDVDISSLKAQQENIAKQVDLCYSAANVIQTVAGADISFNRFSPVAYGALVVFSYPSLNELVSVTVKDHLKLPYIPGYLAFREWPLIQACLERLPFKPDLLICDGQGLAHPRRAGLACHAGVESGLMTIGCAKSRLIGEYMEPGERKGSRSDLLYENQKVGEVVRTRDHVKPLFISPGHRIDFEHATQIILSLCPCFRQPVPIRAAHTLVNQFRKEDTQ